MDRRPVPLASVCSTWRYRVLKRLLDLTLGSTLLVLFAPLIAGLALVIRRDSPGSSFYTWRVTGAGGRPFAGYKLRTMRSDADRLLEHVQHRNEMSGPVVKIRNDPRVTRVGRVLRKLSLDELPQLWSVVKGDMSLVGPRPPLEREFQAFEPWQRRKVSVRPGLTCLWQVNGRSQIRDFDEWVRLDLTYIDNWTFRDDLLILLKTVPAVLGSRGAY